MTVFYFSTCYFVNTSFSYFSVWDLARQFRLNHVHRIPIIEVKGLMRTNELFCLLSLRPIFVEIAKLVSTKCCLSPNLNTLTLSQTKLGKWSQLTTLPEDTKCSQAIDVILEKKVACLPLISAEGKVSGVFCKYDVLASLAEKGEQGIDEMMGSTVKVRHIRIFFDSKHSLPYAFNINQRV